MSMTSQPKKAKAAERPQPRADVSVHDHIYFRHEGQPHHGRVLAVGGHGCTVEHDGVQRRIKWEQMLGHRKRFRPQANIIDHGEDGAIVEDQNGKRIFVSGLVPDESDMGKALLTLAGPEASLRRLAAAIDGGEDMLKALKNAPGLALQGVTDKMGHQTKRWKRTTADEKKGREPGKGDKSGSEAGYGTHNLSAGSKVSFALGDAKGSGEIVSTGKDGATVRDQTGRNHQIHWHEITGHEPAPDAKVPDHHPGVLGEQKPIEPDKFKAADYAKAHDKADVTPDDVLSHFPEDTKSKITDVQKRLAAIEETIKQFKEDGRYNAERDILHAKIVSTLLSPARLKAAAPKPGEKPKFVILGGRGGSGKSWFEGNVYEAEHSIVLDADEIKKQLPEYEGWNAAQVHEESGDIFDRIVKLAKELKVNIVLDKTMKTASSTLAEVKAFKDAGYRTEAHYMHLPRQEAAKRAVGRFLGQTQRYVPVNRVLENTTNEATFDQVRKHVDRWSFRDNNVPKGADPILISQGGGEGTDGTEKGYLTKSEQPIKILLWRK